MSQAEKIFKKMQNNPRDWRIDVVIAVTGRYGIECRNDGGSHHIFSHPAYYETLSVPAHRPIKPVYIKKVIEMILKVKETEV